MKKMISVREFAAVKRNAKTVFPLWEKREKLVIKAQALKAEFDSVNAQLEAYDAGNIAMTGFSTMDLVTAVVVEGKTAREFVPKAGVVTPITETKTKEDGTTYESIKGYEVEIPDEEPAFDGNPQSDSTVDSEAQAEMVEGNEFDPTQAASQESAE